MKDILMLIPCRLGYAWVIGQFCKKYLDISKRKEILFTLVCFISQLFLDVINERFRIPNIAYTLLSHTFYMGLVILLFRADIGKKILASSIFITLGTLLGNFCDSFLCFTFLFFLHTFKKTAVPFLNEPEMYLTTYITYIIVIWSIYAISKRLISVFRDKPGKWYVVLSISLLAITAVIDIANWGASNGILVRSGGNMGLYYDQLFSHAGICVITALAMYAAGFYVFGMDRIYLEQRKSSQYHAQIAAYNMLEEQYRQSERIRHDIKNHVIALSGLLENREWEKMKIYLHNMETAGGFNRTEELTGNKVVDAILYQKKQMAEDNNIMWECDVQIPNECRINEFDLCVLFGNLLDNAVEACERLHKGDDRFINIQAKTVKKCFLLEVQNSSDIANKPANRHTSKENPYEHGIGLLNIRDVVQNYNGVIDMTAKDGIFTISILMPLVTPN